jgi:hypothetical protein
MGLCYQTEYRLGARGGRICRTYTGFHAFLAIVIDLCLGSIFGLIALVFRLIGLALLACWRVAVGLGQLVAHLLVAPFRAARWVSSRMEHRAPRKPAWTGFEEF